MGVASFVLAFAAAIGGSGGQQFDLDCSGPMAKPSQFIRQASVRFRFDLAANKWCEADCGQVHDILEVQPTVIYLDKSPNDVPVEFMHYRQIDRETGEYTYAGRHVFEAAVCSKLPFSGFPSFKTKF